MNSAGKLLQNRYLIQKQIGAGGMGTVYVATDERFGSTVAIKEALFTDPGLRRAFEREAQLLNSLRHPALPHVSDHFTEENGAFIVMEYIAGDDLSVMIERNGAFAVADVLRWADDLLDALDYLHNQKFPVIHRDIKPQNLKLTARGEIILLDFGLAKGSVSELSQVSITKSIFGYSRSYASLEQIQGAGTDPRSDLYSLAATLYHLLTGKLPVDALTRATAVLNGNDDPLPPAHTLNPKIPIGVSQILSNAMALNANLRPPTAAKMRFDLNDAQENPAFYDGATLLAESSRVFTQNTQLMNSDGKTNRFETPLTSDGLTVNAQPHVTVPQPFGTQIDELNAAKNVRLLSGLTPLRRSLPMPMKIGAMILLLGGAVFALFFSDSLNLSRGDQKISDSIQKSPLVSEPAANTNLEAPNPNGAITDNIATSNANQANAGNKSPGTVQIKPSDQQAKTNASKSKPVAASKPEVYVSDEDQADLKDLDKEINEALTDSKDKGNGFDGIPPEIRSNDPRNPVDRQKLKIFIKKQHDEVMRQIQEANRLRALKGLPPITPAKPPKIKIHPQEETEANSNN
jgi:serine/threonine protein kinase